MWKKNVDALREHVESNHFDIKTWKEDQEQKMPSDEEQESVIGKKWYMIGIGGAGCNIVDTIAMRIDQIRDNKEELKIWKEGLVGDYVLLDTNIAGPQDTYIAEKRKWGKDIILNNCIIAAKKHTYTGVGSEWKFAQKYMEEEINEKAIENKINMYDIVRAQGVMLLHSATQGTGCGATPVLSEYLKTNVLKKDTPIFSTMVLPSESELAGGLPNINGIIGFARISKFCDGIILFDNSSLDRNKDNGIINIPNIKKYNNEYGELNNPIVAFLEGVVISKGILDIKDLIGPPRIQLELKYGQKKFPSIICAPVLGKRIRNDFGNSREEKESYLEGLLMNTILNGRLITCDSKTSIGGLFVFHVPDENARKQVWEIIKDMTFHNMIREERFLNDPEGDKHIRVLLNINPSIENIHLWGILWNPKIETLEAMYKYTERYKDSVPIKEVWGDVETVFSNLGGKT